MSRFLIAMFVGATIVAAASTSASAYHCLARAPNGASATAFSVLRSRSGEFARAPLLRNIETEAVPPG
jgi:hypothetical protein